MTSFSTDPAEPICVGEGGLHSPPRPPVSLHGWMDKEGTLGKGDPGGGVNLCSPVRLRITVMKGGGLWGHHLGDTELL